MILTASLRHCCWQEGCEWQGWFISVYSHITEGTQTPEDQSELHGAMHFRQTRTYKETRTTDADLNISKHIHLKNTTLFYSNPLNISLIASSLLRLKYSTRKKLALHCNTSIVLIISVPSMDYLDHLLRFWLRLRCVNLSLHYFGRVHMKSEGQALQQYYSSMLMRLASLNLFAEGRQLQG